MPAVFAKNMGNMPFLLFFTVFWMEIIPSAAYKLYFEVFEEIKKLKEKYPRVQKRSKAVSVYDKELENFLKIYQEFEEEFTRKCTLEE